MAKKSQKRHVQYEKDHSGCIWGLVSIFDFRHGRTNRKLITDRRHGSRHNDTGITKNRFEVLGNLDENRQENLDRNEISLSVGGDAKPSMKELMEVEMVSEQEIKEINNADLESKKSNSVHGQKTKRRRKKSKSWRKSGTIEIDDLASPENMGTELSCTQISGKHSNEAINVDNMMEEFYRQIQQKGINCEEHERDRKGGQLDVAIREFINQKVIDNRQLTRDGDVQELMDIFQILSLDEELFFKLIQDPNSPLVNYTRSQHDTQSGILDLLSEHKSSNIKKYEELVNNKPSNIFRRLVKPKESSLLTEKAEVSASKKIVILKPSPTALQRSEIENNLGSSSESQNVVRSKCTNKKASSYFSFSKFRGKIRNAMGKEGNDMSTGSAGNSYQSECRKIGEGENANSSDSIGKSSPGKDHFFIERFAKPSTSLKRRDRSIKAKNSDLINERGTNSSSGRKASNIYIEAKRHLSEMLSTGDGDAESSSRRVPRTLGRILSLPEFSSPINSPKTDLVYKHDITTIGCSGYDKGQMVNKDTETLKEENEESSAEQATLLEVEISANENDSQPQTLDPISNTKNELICDSTMATTCSITEDMDTLDDMEIQKPTTDVCIQDSRMSDASCQPSSTFTRDCHNDDLSEVHKSYEDKKIPSPESPPPSIPWFNERAEEKEAATCTQERPSPVSVLEPMFVEDDISPERNLRRRESELLVQPLCIRFEECEQSPPMPHGTHPDYFQDKESVIEYVNAVLQASDLKWDELYLGSISSDHLLEASLFDKLELFKGHHHEQKLLFDITNEVLMEVYESYFDFSLWVAFVKPGIRPPPNAKDITSEVCKGVLYRLVHLQQPCTLDQIVKKDMARSDTWLDLRCDAENIGFAIGEAIIDELLDETMLSCLRDCPGDIPLLLESNLLESSEVESSKCEC